VISLVAVSPGGFLYVSKAGRFDRLQRRATQFLGKLARRATLGSAMIVAVAACGGTSAHRGGDTATVTGQHTIATGSFRFNVDDRTFDITNPSRLVKRSTQQGVVDLAHNRSQVSVTDRSYQPDDPTSNTPMHYQEIAIEGDAWVTLSDPILALHSADDKRWFHLGHSILVPPSPILFNPTTLLRLLTNKGSQMLFRGRESVRGVKTDHYRVDPAPTETKTVDPNSTMELWIDEQGLVRRLREVNTHSQMAPQEDKPEPDEVTWEFYDFRVNADIQAPPQDLVSEGVTVPTTTEAPSTTLPTLPPPTVNGPSALQIREVISDRSAGCTSMTRNSPANQLAILQSKAGTCYSLGFAVLTVPHAATKTVADPKNGQVTIMVTLDSSQVAAFDAIAAGQGEFVAAMFGRVLSGVTIDRAPSAAHLVVAPIDPETAALVVRDLAG
jgi:hypothetical protein